MGSARWGRWLFWVACFVMGYAIGEVLLRAMGVVPW